MQTKGPGGCGEALWVAKPCSDKGAAVGRQETGQLTMPVVMSSIGLQAVATATPQVRYS